MFSLLSWDTMRLFSQSAMLVAFAAIALAALHLPSSDAVTSFAINGFRASYATGNMTLSGAATFTPGFGNLLLTDGGPDQVGRGFYSESVPFKSTNGSVSSFATTFIFRVDCPTPYTCGRGFAFALSPSRDLPGSSSDSYLGLFNASNDTNGSNHVVAVEFITSSKDAKPGEYSDDGVGVTVSSQKAKDYIQPFYSVGKKPFKVSLKQGGALQAWINYDGVKKTLAVAVGIGLAPKPDKPMLTEAVDLSAVLGDETFIGFTAATGHELKASYHIMGWSFALGGEAQPLQPPAPPNTTAGSLPLTTNAAGNAGPSLVGLLLAFVLVAFGLVGHAQL